MEISLFPLPSLVLFPNVVVPLHIFEDRYKLMINACIDNHEVFGLVLLHAGAEEESEDTIHRVGVTARVVEVERIDEGRMNILTEGESRFRIFRFTQQKPYWKASVELLEDAESAAPLESLCNEVTSLYGKLLELGTKLGAGQESEVTLPELPVDLSYMIGYVLDIEAEEKQKLLEMTSTSERLRVLAQHLANAISRVEQQIAINAVAAKVRGNGDLGKPGSG
jgi:Lon protease-like protein